MELIAAVIIIILVYAKRDTWFGDMAFVRRFFGFYLLLSALVLIATLVISGYIFSRPAPPAAPHQRNEMGMALILLIPAVAILALSIALSLTGLLARRMSALAMQIVLVANSLLMIPIVTFAMILAISLGHAMANHTGPFR